MNLVSFLDNLKQPSTYGTIGSRCKKIFNIDWHCYNYLATLFSCWGNTPSNWKDECELWSMKDLGRRVRITISGTNSDLPRSLRDNRKVRNNPVEFMFRCSLWMPSYSLCGMNNCSTDSSSSDWIPICSYQLHPDVPILSN